MHTRVTRMLGIAISMFTAVTLVKVLMTEIVRRRRQVKARTTAKVSDLQTTICKPNIAAHATSRA